MVIVDRPKRSFQNSLRQLVAIHIALITEMSSAIAERTRLNYIHNTKAIQCYHLFVSAIIIVSLRVRG